MIRSFRLSCAATLAAIALAALAPNANAQANLTFTGGSGTPLTITLLNPVTFNMTGTTNQVIFVLDSVSTVFNGTIGVGGNITFTVNGGPTQMLTSLQGDVNANDVTTDDFALFGGIIPSSAGNTVVLSAGTLTTNQNFASTAPTSGTFTTFIVNNSAQRVSSNGVAVTAPEPGSIGLALVGGIGLMGAVVRRRKA
jgi:hypothetical protein